jgi:UDP-glucose 4-epimerase
VGDVVNALIALILHQQAYGEVFNVGHTKEISIYELAVLVKKLTESDSEIRLIPYDQAYEVGFEDMVRRLPEILKIRTIIGYQPTLDLSQMLELVIKSERTGA